MTEPQGADTGGGQQPAESPGYKSPLEQALENLPFGIFRTLAESMGKTKGGGGSGGSFEFSIEEMRELHRQFSQEAEALRTMSEKSIRSSQTLQPLASDDASMKHFTAAQDHYGKLSKAILQQLTFAEGFRDAVGAAIGLKSGDEESIAGGANKIAGNVA